MASGVRDIDHGWKKIRREVRRTPRKMEIIVGIQGSQASQDNGGLTNAVLGTIHEFGAPKAGIVQRAFLRGTIEREGKKYQELVKDAAARLSIGQGLRKQLEIIGLVVVADIKKTFNQSIGLAPLKAATIAAKGSSKPLIDVGTLRESITSVVK